MSPAVPFMVKTKVSWTGEQEGDLGFLENETIRVFHTVDDLWWQGSLVRNGSEGIFPKDFVEVLSSSGSTPNTPVKDPSVGHRGSAAISSSASPSPAKFKYSGKTSNPPTPSKDRNSNTYGTPSKDRVNAYGTPSKDRSNAYGTPAKDRSFNTYGTPAKDRSFNGYGTPSKSERSSHNLGYRMSPKSKSTPAVDEMNMSYDDPDASYLSLRSRKSPKSKQKPQNNLYSQYVLGSGMVKANTTDNLVETKRLSQMISPNSSPVKMNKSLGKMAYQTGLEPEKDDFYHSLSQRKLELELQLQQLKELERSHLQSNESSFISEDLLSARQQQERYESRGTDLTDEDDDDDEPPPPPKHKRYDDFERDFASSAISDQYHEKMKSSLQSDVLNLSELSATSAGSFYRHKFERNEGYDDQDLRTSVARLNMDEEEDVMNAIFKDKKSKHPKVLQKLFKKKPEMNLMEQRLVQEPDDWQTIKIDLNRMNTLTSHDKQLRTKRVLRSEGNFIVKPLEYISEINTNETFGPDDEPEAQTIHFDEKKVEAFVAKYAIDHDFNDLISDISVKFSQSQPNQIRAILLHLCKFEIIAEEGERISQAKPKLKEVLQTHQATIFQLNYIFKKLLQALRIPAEVVLGFWKKPNEFYHSDQFSVNHCWLSVMVESDGRGNGCFKLIDLLCFKNGSICNVTGENEFYFLTNPLDLVSTHLPSVIELQHVTPPIDLNVSFHLPRTYSGFQTNGLQFLNFNNSLTRMADLEFFEADLLLPPETEAFVLIKTSRTTSNDFTLCQAYWRGNQRMAKIKAVLPEKEDIGVLQIFAGPKGKQTHFDNIHELACVIPLYHSGKNKQCAFVPRFPTIRAQNNDLYVKHPQVSTISCKNTYNFEIDVHPSTLPTSGLDGDFKIVIESPSGKYSKLVQDNPGSPYGTFKQTIACQEKGLYRGLVIGDTGTSWYVFAQWESV